MAITKADRALLKTRTRVASAAAVKARAAITTEAEMDAYIRGEEQVEPEPDTPLNPWAHMSIGPAKVVKIVKHFYSAESAEFTPTEIASYALNYPDGTVADTVRMVGFHLRHRLEAREAGEPQRDDSKGVAAAVEAAAARAEAAALELEELEG